MLILVLTLRRTRHRRLIHEAEAVVWLNRLIPAHTALRTRRRRGRCGGVHIQHRR